METQVQHVPTADADIGRGDVHRTRLNSILYFRLPDLDNNLFIL